MTLSVNSWFTNNITETAAPADVCTIPQYYAGTGITINGAGTQSSTTSASPPPSSSSPPPASVKSSPPPSSVSAASPPPNSASTASPPSPSPSSTTFVQKLKHTFNMDYATLASNSTKMAAFSAGVVAAIATAANVPTSYISVASVTAGSVVVSTEITFPSSSFTAGQANAVASAVMNSASTTFSTAFQSTYSISGTITVSRQFHRPILSSHSHTVPMHPHHFP